MPRKKNKKSKLIDLTKLEIVDRFTPSIIKNLTELLKNCWDHPVHIPSGKWFIIKKGISVLAAGQLDENNTLWNLCTNKKYRGNGLARKIIHAMLNKICKEKGVMSLFVDSSSPKSWYEHLGFKTINREDEREDEREEWSEYERIEYAHRPDVEKMSRYACSFKQLDSFCDNNSFTLDVSNGPTPDKTGRGSNFQCGHTLPKRQRRKRGCRDAKPFSFRMEKHLQDLYEKKYSNLNTVTKRVTDDANLIHNISQFLEDDSLSTAASKAGKETRQIDKKKTVLRDQGMRLMQNALDGIFSTDDQISETAFKQFKSYVDPPSKNPRNYDLLSPNTIVKAVFDKKDQYRSGHDDSDTYDGFDEYGIPLNNIHAQGYKKLRDFYTTRTDSEGKEYYNITKSDHNTYHKPELYTANISPRLRRERLFVYITDLLRNVNIYPITKDSSIIKLIEEIGSKPDKDSVSQPVQLFLYHYLDSIGRTGRNYGDEYVSTGIKKFNDRLDKIKVCLGKILDAQVPFIDDIFSVDGMRDPEGYKPIGDFRTYGSEVPIEFVIRLPSDFMFQYLINKGVDLGPRDQYGQDILFMITGWGTTTQLNLLYDHFEKNGNGVEFLRGQIDDSGKKYPNYDSHDKPSNTNGLKFGRVFTKELFHKRGGDSPLLIASFKCRLEMVKEFVKLSLPATCTQAQRYNFMNQRNAHMCTPLIASMYKNICGSRRDLNRDSNYDLLPAKQVELVKFLIENGADPNLGEQISGNAGDYTKRTRRKLGPSTGAREYNKHTPLMLALFEQRFGNFNMSVEWARFLVDHGASVLQLDNKKQIITFSTKDARAKNKERTGRLTLHGAAENLRRRNTYHVSMSVPEMEILATTVDAELANTNDYIPIVCKSNTICRPRLLLKKTIPLLADPLYTTWDMGNATLGLYISHEKEKSSYTRMWGSGSFGGGSDIGILDEENIGRYPKRNFSSMKNCEDEIRIRSKNDIINWLIDKAGSMGDPRINSLLESIKNQIADIGSKTGVLQPKWRQSIARVPEIEWGKNRFRMRGQKKGKKQGKKQGKKSGRKPKKIKPRKRRATKPKPARKKIHKNQLIVDNILAQTCKKIPEGVTHCLVQTRKGTHYVPIVKTNGKCKLDIKGHPGIDMTNRCGKDITEDLNFHSATAKKQWDKVCKYDSDGYLMNSDNACMTKKKSSCNVMFRMKNEDTTEQEIKVRAKVLSIDELASQVADFVGSAITEVSHSVATKQYSETRTHENLLKNGGMFLIQECLDGILSGNDDVSNESYNNFKKYVNPPKDGQRENYNLFSDKVIVRAIFNESDVQVKNEKRRRGKTIELKNKKKLIHYFKDVPNVRGKPYFHAESRHTNQRDEQEENHNLDLLNGVKSDLYIAQIPAKIRRERVLSYIIHLLRNVGPEGKITSKNLKDFRNGMKGVFSKPMVLFLDILIRPTTHSLLTTAFYTGISDTRRERCYTDTGLIDVCREKLKERLKLMKLCLDITIDKDKIDVNKMIWKNGSRSPEGFNLDHTFLPPIRGGKAQIVEAMYGAQAAIPIIKAINAHSDFVFEYLISNTNTNLGYKDDGGQGILFTIMWKGTVEQLNLLYDHYQKIGKGAEFLRGQIDDNGNKYPNYDAHCKKTDPGIIATDIYIYNMAATEEIYHKRGSDCPLLMACYGGRINIIKEFVRLAFPLDRITREQKYEVMNQQNANFMTPLTTAMDCMMYNKKPCKYFHRRVTYDTGIENGEERPLDSVYTSLSARQVFLIEFLIKNGADPNLGHADGLPDTLRQIEAHNVRPTGARIYNMNTPLMTAVYAPERYGGYDNAYDLARLLVDNNASVLQMNNKKELITLSTNDAREAYQKMINDNPGSNKVIWSVEALELFAINREVIKNKTTDYIPIVCQRDSLCRVFNIADRDTWKRQNTGHYTRVIYSQLHKDHTNVEIPTEDDVLKELLHTQLLKNKKWYTDDPIEVILDWENIGCRKKSDEFLRCLSWHGRDTEDEKYFKLANEEGPDVKIGLYLTVMRGNKAPRTCGSEMDGLNKLSDRYGKPDEFNKLRNFTKKRAGMSTGKTATKALKYLDREGKNDILNWLRRKVVDTPSHATADRLGLLLDSIKNQIKRIGTAGDPLQKEWTSSIAGVRKINWYMKFHMNPNRKKRRNRNKKSIKKRRMKCKKSLKKRSIKRKKSIKKSTLRKPGKNRRKRIPLKKLVAMPLRNVEVGRVPISVGRGHNVTISGLINCIGVIITQYSSETGAPVSVIAGHFETPKMYDSAKHTLTKAGEKFATRIVNLIHKINTDLQTTVQFFYGDSDPSRIVSSKVIGKIPNDTGEAFSALKEKLGLHHVKLEPIVGRNKSKITIRIPR
jgi:ankyrin repeat protein